MTFTQRLSYFGGGVFIGSIFLIFFLSGKKTTCDYSPNARVLKNIRSKERFYSPQSEVYMLNKNIDTSVVSAVLKNGSVDFSNSNTQSEPCKTYSIIGEVEDKNLNLIIENCEEKATIIKVEEN